jgi:two-component system LytT family response regulator
VDDEPAAREVIATLLADHPRVRIVGEATNGRQAVEVVRRTRPDLLFLDVQMPDEDGFGVLEALGDDVPRGVVFVTAHDEHAVRAFDVHAADYLLKPVEPERFHVAVARVRGRLGEADAARRHAQLVAILADGAAAGPGDAVAPPAPTTLAVASGTPRYRERLLAKVDGRMYFVRAADIDWVEAEGDYARIHAGRRTHLVSQRMHALERLLEAREFVRVHRSAIVRRDKVRAVLRGRFSTPLLELDDGHRLPVGRKYREAVRTAFDAGG